MRSPHKPHRSTAEVCAAPSRQRGDAVTAGTRLLEGKVAIVTGASRGIGAVAARAFAAAGAAVVLAARDEGALAAVAEQITASGGRAPAVPTHVGGPRAVERL